MIYSERKRNTPIATLIKNYINKKSGKVTESREEIQRRFDHLDWKDQKRIMQAFLDSGKTDRLWAYSKLLDYWDKSFESRIKELWEQLHEDKCAWVITRHFPKEYLSQHIDQFTGDRDYCFICLRLADDKNFVIDRSRLSATDYLSVLYHTGRTLSDDKARDCLYNIVCAVCTEDNIYTQLSRYAIVDKDTIIGPILFQNVNLAVYYLRKMDLTDVVQQFERWNEGVQSTIFSSLEYRTIIKADLPEYDMREAMAKVTKKYSYLALSDKYKKADFSIEDILTPREWFAEGEGWKKESGPENHSDLRKLIAQNPAIEKLIEDLNCEINK